MYFTLLVVVIITAIALVALALGIARAISPRSYNPQKGEAYECGLLLFAILMMNTAAGTGAVLQMLSHGLMTALFFALIGMIHGRTHTRDIRELARLPRLRPIFLSCRKAPRLSC